MKQKKGEKHDKARDKKKKAGKVERRNNEIAGLRAAVAVRDNRIRELQKRLNTEDTEDTEDSRGGSPTRPENTGEKGDKIQTENTMLPVCPWCGHVHPFPADHKHDYGYSCFSCGKSYFAEAKAVPRADRFGTDYYWTTEKAEE